MAVISDVTFGATTLTDIKSNMLHSFATSGTGSYYFGYVNSSNHGVVYRSTDHGASWTLVQDYGVADYVAVTAAKDGDIVVTVSSASANLTSVYKAFSLVRTTTLAPNGAVTFWPMYFTLAGFAGTTPVSTTGDISAGAITGLNLCTVNPIIAVLNYGTNSGEYLTVSYTSLDVTGWQGPAPVKLSNFHTGPSPSNPLVTVALWDSVTYNQSPYWPGLVSSSFSGYVSSTNFGGAGTGGNTAFIFSASAVANLRGNYFTGYPDSTVYAADRGLVATHKTAFQCTVDGTTVCFFVDRNGLLGSTYDTGNLASVDSSGTLTPFARARIYGNNTNTWGSLSWGDASQTGSLTVFMLTNNSGETAHTLYRLSDPAPLVRTHSNNTQLLSQLTTVTTGTGTTVDPFAITTNSNAIGTVRVTSQPATYGTDLLIQACTQDGLVPNPNKSPGCTPILRELMNQSGVPYSVVLELANDGDPNGHEGGNAIDFAGPSTSTVLTGASVNDAALQELAAIGTFIRAVPSLFAMAIHYDPITPSNSVYIWDGKLTNAAQFGGITAQIVTDSTSVIHVSSSKARLLAALQSPVIQAALGVGPPVTNTTTGQTTSEQVPDYFNSDRYVYVNDDGYIGTTTQGLAAEKEPAQTINFW